MDKIEKFLKKFNKKQKTRILAIIRQIECKDLTGLDVKKLSDTDNTFRIRQGKIRIIFIKLSDEHRIVSIERRSDNTYKF